ncbi:carboxylesterase/lipase family protein [Pelagerythrobacter aerophilus]|uniref:Carboxylic ester hydrolase n=1 Tax=Pelagerythrobacter aerophilus TaxID=2306995 RepID=A0A418NCT9_9SPHN|nr:carboxylesterase family protein [Pelagerythrobacter aerophilus]RIV75528.1 carboxylesterase family protein [Pelagerythrobacter aerophilus]
MKALRLPLALLFALLPAGAWAGSDEAGAPQVTIEQGQLAGTREGELAVYRGIPYAAPPVGERRWKPPGPAPNWSGVRSAPEFGPACTQPALPPSSLYYEPLRRTSEDCLTLNVWAPERARKAPVIVWLHGGSLRVGSSASPMYDGANFARRGAVFVSLNYRLGALGWMAHRALSDESSGHVSGNYGLLDQIAALRWVRANVAAFGGDPDNVTVMGESAGALSVSYLLVSPLARGLFDKAIVQSANARAFPALAEPVFGMPSAETTGERLFDKLDLRDLPTARAMDAQQFVDRAAQAGFSPQGTIDGEVLPMQIIDAFDRGAQAKVPVLAGINSGEVRAQRALLPPAPTSAEAYEDAAKAAHGDLAAAFLRLYPSDRIDQSMLATARDGIYGWATERIVRKQAAEGQNAYFFVFDHCYAAARARDLCAFHAGELAFVFGRLRREDLPPNWPVPSGPADAALSQTMMDYWVSFAATGTPRSDHGPAWPGYGEGEAYIRFDHGAHQATDPLPGMFELHEEIVQRRKRADRQWFLSAGVDVSPERR